MRHLTSCEILKPFRAASSLGSGHLVQVFTHHPLLPAPSWLCSLPVRTLVLPSFQLQGLQVGRGGERVGGET